MFIGLVFLMLMFTMLIMELGAVYNNYFEVESIVHRTVGNVVEDTMADSYRADRESKIEPSVVEQKIANALEYDLPSKYRWETIDIQFGTDPQGVTVEGKITFDTVFSKYGFPDVAFPMTAQAYNERLE